MDPTSLASALVGAQLSRAQTAVAAKMLKMNAQAEASIAQLLDSAQANLKSLVGAGLGQNLDISV